MPMSIFVLNLATLLGLGLGVDYSLLMTSRFREELALRPDGPERVAEAVRITVATAGRAVFFSGLTVLLGLLGLVLFEFMILRSVGIAGAIVVGLAVASALTLLPAILTILGPRVDRFAVRKVAADAPARTGAWARLARRVMRHPIAVLIPTLAFLLLLGSPFLHVRFNAPDASILPPEVPSRAAFDRLRARVRRGRVRADRPGHPDRRRRRRPRPTSPRCTTTRAGWRRIRASRRVDSLVDVDPRLTLAQYTLLYGDPNGPRDRYVQTALAATTRGDLTAFTLYTPYGPNRDEGKALVTDLRTPGGPLAPPAGVDGPGRGRRRGRRRRRRPGRAPTSRGRPCSSS